MDSNSILCITFAIIAYITLNLGLVLQKHGASLLPPIEQTSLRANLVNFLKTPSWLIGFLLVNLQIIPFWIALTYGPISLVTPMIGAGMLALVFFSRVYLREPISRPMYVGIALIGVGLVVFGVASSNPQIHHTWSETIAIVSRTGSIVYLALLAFAVIVPVVLSVSMRYWMADVLFGLASGLAASIGMIFSKLMMSGFDQDTLYANLSLNTGRWQFFLFMGCMLVGNTGAMVTQQFGFQKGKAIIVAPIFTVGCVLIPAITGVVLFEEWSTDGATRIGVKASAMVLIVVGVAILSYFDAVQSKG